MGLTCNLTLRTFWAEPVKKKTCMSNTQEIMLINKPNTVHTTHATDTTQLPDNQRALTDQACLWTDKKRVRKGSISFICTLYFFWNLGASQWEVCSGHWSLNITVNMLKWSLKAIGKPFVVESPLPGAGYYYPTPVYFSSSSGVVLCSSAWIWCRQSPSPSMSVR